MLTLEIAIAKTHKYAVRDSGDTAETVERPNGGMSVVMVDGQGSGAAAKSLSMMVSGRAVSLLKEGVRDGAVARAAHDHLHAYRGGKVSATLDIVSVDLASSTMLVTRNSVVPYLVRQAGEVRMLGTTTTPIGLYRHSRPSVDQYPLEEGLSVVVFSDGIPGAGSRTSERFDILEWARASLRPGVSAHEIADAMLAAALNTDRGRPNDDMTVVSVTIGAAAIEQPIRTLRLNVPFTPSAG